MSPFIAEMFLKIFKLKPFEITKSKRRERERESKWKDKTRASKSHFFLVRKFTYVKQTEANELGDVKNRREKNEESNNILEIKREIG